MSEELINEEVTETEDVEELDEESTEDEGEETPEDVEGIEEDDETADEEPEEDADEDAELEELNAGYTSYREQTAEVAKWLKGQGLDLDTMAAHYFEHGKLSDADYEKLEAAGYKDKNLIDVFCSNLGAKTQYYQDELVKALGGLEAYTEIQTKLKKLPNTRARINKALSKGDWKEAVKALKAIPQKGSKKNDGNKGKGSRGAVVGKGSNAKTGGVKPLASWDEINKIQRDPRFDHDKKFMETYYARLQKTDWLRDYI